MKLENTVDIFLCYLCALLSKACLTNLEQLLEYASPASAILPFKVGYNEKSILKCVVLRWRHRVLVDLLLPCY